MTVSAKWSVIIQWVDQDNLLINQYRDFSTTYVPTSSILFNPFTDKQKEYPPDYPNMPKYFSSPFHSWSTYSYSLVIYDPLFSRAIYPGYGDGENQNDTMLIFRDLQNRKEIGHFFVDSIGNGEGAPQWKQDGSSVIMAINPQVMKSGKTIFDNIKDGLPYKGGFDLFDVSRDGIIKRLTYLTTQFHAYEGAFSLSPDGNRIAFWLNLHRLAVLDTTNGNITNLCLTGGENLYSPVWSPDGKYLVMTTDNNESSGTFLIDLQQKAAVKLFENAVVQGWLINPSN
jgi:hypothetical protein